MPKPAKQLVVGQGVNIKKIVDANVELKHNMQQEVLCPLEQWLSAYRTIKVSLEKWLMTLPILPEVRVSDVQVPIDMSEQIELAERINHRRCTSQCDVSDHSACLHDHN